MELRSNREMNEVASEATNIFVVSTWQSWGSLV